MPLRNRHSFWRAGIAVLATALLMFIGNGLNPVWQCVWVAPLPILLFAATAASWRLVAWAAALSMLLGSMSMLYYLHFVLGAPIIAWLAPFSVASLFFAAGVLLYRELLRGNRVLIAVLSFPAMWSLCEYLASLSPANGTAGSLAYTQLSNLPIAQLASITGPWGITFVLLLVPAGAVAAAYLWLTARQQAIPVVCLVTGVLIAALLYGFLRLRSSSPEERIKVGLLATDSVNLAAGSTMQRLTASYGAQAEQLATQGAQIILMPEKVGVIDSATAQDVDSTLQSVSDRTGAVMVMGVVDATSSAPLNEARIYTPHQRIATYQKQHLLAPFESKMIPGSSLTSISNLSRPVGVAICKDMDFIRPGIDYGRLGVALMLDPAWDFNIDRTWHGHIAIMRGIENGYSVAHTSKEGLLTITDDRGQLLGERRSDSAFFVSLLVSVPLRHDDTFFNRYGTWFPYGCGIILITAIYQLAGSKSRTSLPAVSSSDR